MGQNQAKESNILYSVPVTQASNGETEVYRHPEYTSGLVNTYDDHIQTLQDVYLDSVKKYPENRLFGKKDPSTSQYTVKYQLLGEGIKIKCKEVQQLQRN